MMKTLQQRIKRFFFGRLDAKVEGVFRDQGGLINHSWILLMRYDYYPGLFKRIAGYELQTLFIRYGCSEGVWYDMEDKVLVHPETAQWLDDVAFNEHAKEVISCVIQGETVLGHDQGVGEEGP